MSGKQLAVAALGFPAGTWLIFYLQTNDAATIGICMLSALAVSHLLVEVFLFFRPRKPKDGDPKKR